MKELLIFSIIFLLFSCTKEEPQPAVVTPPVIFKHQQFLGVWRTNDFGGYPFELVIEYYNDSAILLHGQLTAIVNGNTFQSKEANSVTHTGSLQDSVLTYCQEQSPLSLCGDFLRIY